MSPFNELDVVELVEDLPSEGLVAGQRGTIHAVQRAKVTNYLVEFTDEEGTTLALLPVSEDKLALIWEFRTRRFVTTQDK
ncbi:MAG TPA: DUF4926 domain-containing protein [Chloroflexia bacterium]|nr:DUF4926 domain-containing protein [Chloroflexia bacterium]